MNTHYIHPHIKKILPILLLLFLFLQACSENPVHSSGKEGPLEGAWVTEKIVNDDYTQVFDNTADDYLNSLFIRFIADKFERWYNRDGQNYDVYTWDLSYGQDSVVISSGANSTMYYHFILDTLVLQYTTPFGNNEAAYYTEYKGKLPPESWTE